MSYSPDFLQAAYDKHSIRNRGEIEASRKCGCFACFAVFPSSAVWDWIGGKTPGQETGVCPYCWMDAIIGDASMLPATEQVFLRVLNDKIFEGPVYWDQVADPHPITVGCHWEYGKNGNGTARPIYAETDNNAQN